MEDTIRFFYSTLLPAVVLVPWWFHSGRYWMLQMGQEGDDWIVTDTASQILTEQRALPGIVLFHVVLWWRERRRQRHNNTNNNENDENNENHQEFLLLEVALGLWGVYILQFMWQIFYVVTVCDATPATTTTTTTTTNTTCHRDHDWSVATRILGDGMTTALSDRIALGLALDVWILMGATLITSFWFSLDERYHGLSIRKLIRLHMTNSLQWSIGVIPVWYVLGHMALGSGGFGNTSSKNILWLVGQALCLVLPCHYFLWHRHKNHAAVVVVSEPMAWILLIYYGLQFFHQLVVLPDGFLERSLPLTTAATAVRSAKITKVLLAINMVLLVAISCYYEEERIHNRSNTDPDTDPVEIVNEDGNAVATTSAAITTNNAAPAEQLSPEAEMRVPLLENHQHVALRTESETPAPTVTLEQQDNSSAHSSGSRVGTGGSGAEVAVETV